LIHITLTADHLLKRWPPKQEAAWARVRAVEPASYARTRNHLEGAVTGLSPYITHGVLTLPQVLQGLLEQGPLEAGHKLVYELGWREFFRHAWAHWGSGIEASLHPGPLPDEAYATELPVDIREACTGVPAIDQAVRTLYATGYLHNHARMWLASYVVHLRRVHWRAGADWMVAHLLDGDLASNHLSWQWVAGTGSSKPYLFNAENVARFAPAPWHSLSSVIDRSYEDLDLIARGVRPAFAMHHQAKTGMQTHPLEPVVCHQAPAGLNLTRVDAALFRGRDVWLVHPWALRLPPADLPSSALVVGVYVREYHQRWPWSQARWHWVDAAMREITLHRYELDAATLRLCLGGAAHVRSMADPHISPWLSTVAQLDEAPALFPDVERPCTSFSQWWTRATRGLKQAHELL
jgi:deoxyribodipyrimidine photo-lyase